METILSTLHDLLGLEVKTWARCPPPHGPKVIASALSGFQSQGLLCHRAFLWLFGTHGMAVRVKTTVPKTF